MNALDVLKTALLDLVLAVGDEIPLIVGGGFGLYLRQEQLRQSGERTLLEQLPEPRATNDIDLFVRMEVLVRVETVQALQQHIEQLEFEPVKGAEYFQWIRNDSEGREVKIDLLCGPLGEFSERLYTNSLPRVRPKAPKGTLKFHARQTDEAIELDTRAVAIQIEGQCSVGAANTSTIHIPHPFTYLMMKLFAFDDRKEDEKKDVGRHHAMDLYRVVAMMTEPEYGETVTLGETYKEDSRVERARQIVSDHFRDPTDLGMLRLREHPLFRDEFAVEGFSDVLNEVFSIVPDQ